jgi:hypothetical protein
MRAIYDLRLFSLFRTTHFVRFASKGHSSLLKVEPKKILLALSCFAPFWFVEKRSLQRSQGAKKEYIFTFSPLLYP